METDFWDGTGKPYPPTHGAEPTECNGGQAMSARGWLQGVLEAMDARYGRRGKVVGKAMGERQEVIP